MNALILLERAARWFYIAVSSSWSFRQSHGNSLSNGENLYWEGASQSYKEQRVVRCWPGSYSLERAPLLTR